jgi:acyl-homoserine-lactone acylase
LARAVQVLTKAGYPIDAPLGDLQYTERSGQRIPLHGGFGSDGVTNILSWSGANNTTESLPGRGDTVVPGSSLTPTGYPINYGSSFIMVVDFSTGAPQAWTILVYGETGDRTSSLFELQTLMYSQKQWKQVLFAQQAIYESPDLSVLEVSGEQA